MLSIPPQLREAEARREHQSVRRSICSLLESRVRYDYRMTLQEFFLRQKDAIHVRSRQVFALLRPEQAGWKPEAGALSIAETLRHLWVSEEGVRRVALEGNFAYYEARIPGGLGAVLGTPGSIADELHSIERVHADTLARVAALQPQQFEEERANEQLGFRRKVSVILYGINDHEIHHRAQLMTYLRMLGTPAPEPFARR
jgi:uncharacterized damage-inducible protein DinB